MKAEIIGYVSDFMKNEIDSFIGEGNIVKGQTIKGIDNKGNIFKIKESFLGDFQTNSYQNNYRTKGTIIFDSLNIDFLTNNSTKENDRRYDWFVCKKIPPHFWGITNRQLKLSPKKGWY